MYSFQTTARENEISNLLSTHSYSKHSFIFSPTACATGGGNAFHRWKGAKLWAQNANKIAPTLVGGSKKHGGPDLGPVRARKAWAELGVDGRGVANTAPELDFEGMPPLDATPALVNVNVSVSNNRS